MNKMNRKGAILGWSLMDILQWVMFFIIAAAAVYILVKRLTV